MQLYLAPTLCAVCFVIFTSRAPHPEAAESTPSSLKLDCESVGYRLTGFYKPSKPPSDMQPQRGAPYNTPNTNRAASVEQLLNSASAELHEDRNIESFLVVRQNDVLIERYYGGTELSDSKNIHSVSKSIWGAAIGIAIEQKLLSLEAPLSELLPQRYVKILDSQKSGIKLKHLINMTAGFEWTENKTEYEFGKSDDWGELIIKRAIISEAGNKFLYSTGNSHLVSIILDEALRRAGKTNYNSCQFIYEHLLEKIGISVEKWGVDPQGHFAGGFGMYITPREMAKLGMLYLNGGKWEGQQVVPQSWVESSMESQVYAVATDSGVPYGYSNNWWIGSIGGYKIAMAWGYGGQIVYVVKDLDLVVVITSDTSGFLKADEKKVVSRFEGVIRKYVIPAFR